MSESVALTFLGTGNFNAQGRYWNSFLIGRRVLVEPSPIALANLFRAGVDATEIDVIFLSHFHADHSFGWPFLLLNQAGRRRSPLWVVGPPGLQAFLEEMTHAGRLDHLVAMSFQRGGGFPLHYVEADEREQAAGDIRFRAVRVEHDPALDCFGYLIQQGSRSIGYSGDTILCDGLRRIAAGADALVLECNQAHGQPRVHMSLERVRALRDEFPALPFVLTHMGADVTDPSIPNVRLPNDLETVRL
ncbi:MAG TPA: MBL fold metallo-hydrolase [Dehalococcoidia bacterium]|nr:MBL fold metallo-hydrolase [Dehalococcoidia bacterium]